MTGLSPVVAGSLQQLRLAEIGKSKDMRKIIILLHGICELFSPLSCSRVLINT